jgi:hypothetical protein
VREHDTGQVRSRTYSTERAIPRHTLYLFAEKGFSAFIGPLDNFRYLPEPVLSCRFRSQKGPFTHRFPNKLPGPDGKTVMLGVCSARYGVSSQLPCRRSFSELRQYPRVNGVED